LSSSGRVLITRSNPLPVARITGSPSIGTRMAGTVEKMTRGGLFLSGWALPF